MRSGLPKRQSTRFDPVIRRPSPTRASTWRRLGARIPKSAYFLLGAAGIALVGFAYVFVFSNQFAITTVNITGTDPESAYEIRARLNEQFSERRWVVFAQNKTVLFPHERTRANIMSTFAGVSDVHLEVSFPNSLNVGISERTPVGIWCAVAGREASSAVDCFFYDEAGIVYKRAPNATRGFLIDIMYDFRTQSAAAGDTVLSPKDVESVTEARNAIERAYVKPQYISLLGNGELHAGFSGGWEAYLSANNDLSAQAQSLALVVEEEVGVRRSELSYIDVRLINKVFYHFKEDDEVGEVDDVGATSQESAQ
ncbi:MAG: hypothetical protein WD850_02600 [Candidatus Spechtbacterales bacterium]